MNTAMTPTAPRPNLDDDQVMRCIAGVRPYREGGIRLEADERTIPGRLLIHNYGHGGAGITMGWGCAEAVTSIVEAHSARTEHVAVLGGGVVGLTAAHDLAKAGHRVTIYASALPPETTSNVAGALFLPAGVDWGKSPEEQQVFIARMRRSWARTEALLGEPGAAVDMRIVYDADATDHHHDDRWLDVGLPTESRRVDALPLPGQVRAGRIYRSLFLETPRFLPWLVERVRSLGVTFEHRSIASLKDVTALPHQTIVNCLGFGAGRVFNDPRVRGARGQLVLLRPQLLGYILQHGWTYMFPRRDALVLGGTFELGTESSTPDDVDCRRILNTHRAFFETAPTPTSSRS
jgi:D-amino-acid oxidase